MQGCERWSCRNTSCSNAAMGRVYSPIFEVPKGKDSCLAWPQENWETNDGELSLAAWAKSSLYVFPSHGATFVIRISHQVQGSPSNPLPEQQLGSIESPRFPRNHEIKLPSSTGLELSHQPKPLLKPPGKHHLENGGIISWWLWRASTAHPWRQPGEDSETSTVWNIEKTWQIWSNLST